MANHVTGLGGAKAIVPREQNPLQTAMTQIGNFFSILVSGSTKRGHDEAGLQERHVTKKPRKDPSTPHDITSQELVGMRAADIPKFPWSSLRPEQREGLIESIFEEVHPDQKLQLLFIQFPFFADTYKEARRLLPRHSIEDQRKFCTLLFTFYKKSEEQNHPFKKAMKTLFHEQMVSDLIQLERQQKRQTATLSTKQTLLQLFKTLFNGDPCKKRDLLQVLHLRSNGLITHEQHHCLLDRMQGGPYQELIAQLKQVQDPHSLEIFSLVLDAELTLDQFAKDYHRSEIHLVHQGRFLLKNVEGAPSYSEIGILDNPTLEQFQRFIYAHIPHKAVANDLLRLTTQATTPIALQALNYSQEGFFITPLLNTYTIIVQENKLYFSIHTLMKDATPTALYQMGAVTFEIELDMDAIKKAPSGKRLTDLITGVKKKVSQLPLKSTKDPSLARAGNPSGCQAGDPNIQTYTHLPS